MLLFSCSDESITDHCLSKDRPDVISLYNNGGKFNCGLEKYDLSNVDQINRFCDEMSHLKKINFFTSTSANYWYVEIKVSNSKWTSKYLTLVKTEFVGYVFKIGSSKYKNDDLAKMIVSMLEITKDDDARPCRQ